MDTYFVHYYEVDDAGKILKFMALDDGASLAKYCVGTTAAEPEALATISKFCAFGDDCAEYATDDCLMNPPGAPPMPVAVMTGMMAGLRASCWPTWKSKFHGATKNADGTYNVLTQQCLGPMAADFPAMGPFPEVKLDSVPEIMKTYITTRLESVVRTVSSETADDPLEATPPGSGPDPRCLHAALRHGGVTASGHHKRREFDSEWGRGEVEAARGGSKSHPTCMASELFD